MYDSVCTLRIDTSHEQVEALTREVLERIGPRSRPSPASHVTSCRSIVHGLYQLTRRTLSCLTGTPPHAAQDTFLVQLLPFPGAYGDC